MKQPVQAGVLQVRVVIDSPGQQRVEALEQRKGLFGIQGVLVVHLTNLQYKRNQCVKHKTEEKQGCTQSRLPMIAGGTVRQSLP